MTLPEIGKRRHEQFEQTLARDRFAETRTQQGSPAVLAGPASLNIVAGGGGVKIKEFAKAEAWDRQRDEMFQSIHAQRGPLPPSSTHKKSKNKTMKDEVRRSLQRASQSRLQEIESHSFFDTKFDNLYNKLEHRKDKEVEHLVKKTKELQKASKLRDLRSSMGDMAGQPQSYDAGATRSAKKHARGELDFGQVDESPPGVNKSSEQRLTWMLNQLN